MYSTCTFCHAPLGRNEALEHFPVGKRVAFDQARGRLWAVCPTCLQWNLSPLETRWEAIEEGEKLYRDTHRRVTTEQIGLATLPDGTELIRVGNPVREEFAAWRYGARFRSRRLLAAAAMAGIGLVGSVAVVGPMLGLAGASAAYLPVQAFMLGNTVARARRIYARGDDADGPFVVTRTQLTAARLVSAPQEPAGWGLAFTRHRGDLPIGAWGPAPSPSDPSTVVVGAQARALVRLALSQMNREGASDRAVRDATALLAESGDVDALFRAGAKRAESTTSRKTRLFYAEAPLRLALEMGVHEEMERRALEGELAALEAQWREAEQIAAIADNLTLPERVARQLDRLRNR